MRFVILICVLLTVLNVFALSPKSYSNNFRRELSVFDVVEGEQKILDCYDQHKPNSEIDRDHVERVCFLASIIGQKLEMDVFSLRNAALIHDLGTRGEDKEFSKRLISLAKDNGIPLESHGELPTKSEQNDLLQSTMTRLLSLNVREIAPSSWNDLNEQEFRDKLFAYLPLLLYQEIRSLELATEYGIQYDSFIEALVRFHTDPGLCTRNNIRRIFVATGKLSEDNLDFFYFKVRKYLSVLVACDILEALNNKTRVDTIYKRDFSLPKMIEILFMKLEKSHIDPKTFEVIVSLFDQKNPLWMRTFVFSKKLLNESPFSDEEYKQFRNKKEHFLSKIAEWTKLLTNIATDQDALRALELIARTNIDVSFEEELVRRIVRMGTERSDVQRALVLYNRLKEKPVPGLWEHFHLNGKKYKLVPDDTVVIADGKNIVISSEDGIHSVFGRKRGLLGLENKRGMVIECHPDDMAIHAGKTTHSLERAALFVPPNLAIKEGDSISIPVGEPLLIKNNPFFVTSVNDEAGVKDWQVEEFGKEHGFPKEIDAKDINAKKRYIREYESRQNAKFWKLEDTHANLDLRLPLEAPYINPQGNLIATESVFAEPSKADQQKVNDFVKNNLCDYYIMVFPFSNHPHHRRVTRMFLDAIAKFHPDAEVYFWADDKEFPQHQMKANTYLLFGRDDEVYSELKTFNGNTSQVRRTEADGRGLEYYLKMAAQISKQAFRAALGAARKKGIDEGMFSNEWRYGYAERFIKVKLIAVNEAISPVAHSIVETSS